MPDTQPFPPSAPARPGRPAADSRPGRGLSDMRLLHDSTLGRGLSPSELGLVVRSGAREQFAADEVILRQGETGQSLYIILRGQVRLDVAGGDAPSRFLACLGPGDHFGEMAILGDGKRTATVTATTDAVLLRIDRSSFEVLIRKVPELAVNLSRTMGQRLHAQTVQRERKPRPGIVGLVCYNSRSRQLLGPLTEELARRGETLRLFTTFPEDGDGANAAGHPVKPLIHDSQHKPSPQRAVQKLTTAIAGVDRVLVQLSAADEPSYFQSILPQCQRILWLVEPSECDRAFADLRSLSARAPALAERVNIVWILERARRFAPRIPDDLARAARDLKVVLDPPGGPASRQQHHSVVRLARHLRGLRVGLALGGGGARGLAHLGVLEALEQSGIVIDCLAGTSSGALMGLSYAAGWSPKEALGHFHRELTPPSFLRHLPMGKAAYMVGMFRLGGWDRKLRHFFGNNDLRQLRLPFSTVAVDLVRGQQVVRRDGDGIHAVLESINLPSISRPIMRDSMALVDGGVLNHLPADVLRQQGADIVIGVDVVAKLPQRFIGMTPENGGKPNRQPGALETQLRVNEIQDYGIGKLRTAAVDLMIEPDTGRFDFTDFTNAPALARCGQRAAEAVMPQIRQLIERVEAA